MILYNLNIVLVHIHSVFINDMNIHMILILYIFIAKNIKMVKCQKASINLEVYTLYTYNRDTHECDGYLKMFESVCFLKKNV